MPKELLDAAHLESLWKAAEAAVISSLRSERRTIDEAIEAGEILTRLKAATPHGDWGPVRSARLKGLNERTDQIWRQMTRHEAKIRSVGCRTVVEARTFLSSGRRPDHAERPAMKTITLTDAQYEYLTDIVRRHRDGLFDEDFQDAQELPKVAALLEAIKTGNAKARACRGGLLDAEVVLLNLKGDHQACRLVNEALEIAGFAQDTIDGAIAAVQAITRETKCPTPS